MRKLQANITRSFGFVRQDIIALTNRIAHLEMQLGEALHQIEVLKGSSPKSTPSAKKHYVASKKGPTAYPEGSFHANNIKRENRIIFTSKTQAIQRGYKAK